MSTASAQFIAYYIDRFIEAATKLLSRFMPLTDAGLFYYPQFESFWDSWVENGETLMVRMGRFEFNASMKKQRRSGRSA